MKIFWTLLVYFSILSCSDQSNLKNRLIQLEETRIDNIQYLMNKHRVDSVKAIFIRGSLDYLTENQVAEFYYSQGDSVGMIDYMTYDWPSRINIYKNGVLKNQIFDMFTKLSYNHINNKEEVVRIQERLGFKNLITFDTSYLYFKDDQLLKSVLRDQLISTYTYNTFGMLEMRRDSIISEKLLLNVSDTTISTRLRYNSKNKLVSSVKSYADYQTIVAYDSLGFPVEKYSFSDLDTIYYLKYSIYK